MTNKTIVFTDLDLDGACSYLIHCWYTQSKPKVVPLKVSTLREKFLGWLNNNKLEDFKEVYFFDIDTTEIKDLIDKKNVTVFDHHKTHADDYKVAEFYIDHDAPSCSKILLNFLFWYKNGDKIQNFVNDFEHGFHGFTNEQNKIISYHIYKFNKLTEELQLFESNVPVGNVNYRFVSTFVDTYVNDVAQHIIDKTNCDVCMLINLKTKRVYFRKRRDTKIDLGKLAKKLCEGGGHEYAAGGILNDVILTLSKQFTPING